MLKNLVATAFISLGETAEEKKKRMEVEEQKEIENYTEVLSTLNGKGYMLLISIYQRIKHAGIAEIPLTRREIMQCTVCKENSIVGVIGRIEKKLDVKIVKKSIKGRSGIRVFMLPETLLVALERDNWIKQKLGEVNSFERFENEYNYKAFAKKQPKTIKNYEMLLARISI